MDFLKPSRPVDRFFIHCSDSDAEHLEGEALREEVWKWHVEENGWDDIAYHWLIDKKGRLMVGRSLEMKSASQYPENKGTISVMIHGRDTITAASLATLKSLCKEVNEAYKGRISFHGHREVREDKTCPNFDYHGVLQLDRFQRMA